MLSLCMEALAQNIIMLKCVVIYCLQYEVTIFVFELSISYCILYYFVQKISKRTCNLEKLIAKRSEFKWCLKWGSFYLYEKHECTNWRWKMVIRSLHLLLRLKVVDGNIRHTEQEVGSLCEDTASFMWRSFFLLAPCDC